MTVTVKKVVDNTAELAARLRALAARQVLVGVPATTTDRQDDDVNVHPMTNAELAYIHNYGSPANNIPARPFMQPGIDSVRDEITRRYKTGGAAILAGRLSDPDIIHNAVGLIVEGAIKRKITEGPFTPLAPRTLAARRARGVTRTKPLIDTTQMRSSITYVVRDRNA